MLTKTSTVAAGRAAATRDREWELTAERGPDWLFVRVQADGRVAPPVPDAVESIWGMIQEHSAGRVVLELDGIKQVDELLLGIIGEIGSRMRDAGGLMRVCGLSQSQLSRHRQSDAAGVPCYPSRIEAVGPRPCPEGRCE